MFAVLALSPLLALAPDPQRGLTFDTALKSVAVFRDGYGYYVREGKVKLENGWATTSFVPNAIRGTVWVYSLDKADRVDTVITTKENHVEFANVPELKAKLADKVGLTIVVNTHSGQRFEGRLSRILDDMILIQIGAAFNAIPLDQVKAVSLVGYPIKVKVDTRDPNKTTTLGIAYLQEGIRWEPSYVLDIEGAQSTLDLRASMQNTTEALSKSDVLFVVGSPFVTNRGMTDMSGIVPPTAIQATTADSTKTKDTDRPAPDREEQQPALKPTVSGEEGGELYFYRKPNLSLDTNDVAMVSIFHSDVTTTPQFEWDADGEEVMYLLSIQNTTKQPLTTGPVFVVEDGKALGQETIKYTPSGANAEVRLSRGIGLRVEKTEAESKRGPSVKIGKSDFIPVTLKGTLTITNFRGSAAPIKITKTARGRVVTLSDDGKVKQTAVLSGEVNPLNDLEWKVSVPKGGVKVVTYTIETYIFADRSGTPPVPATPGGGD